MIESTRCIGRWTVAFALAALVGGCGDDDPTGPRDPEDVQYAPELGIDLDQMTRLPSGVYIQTISPGDGAIALENDQIVVNFTGWLSDGTEFDSGEEVQFRLSSPPLIEGFVEGTVGMAVGETRKMVIPSELGFGAGGGGGIPPHSVLVFEVELLAVNPVV